MRLGMLPSQKRALQRVFKKADKFDHFRSRTRRAFVGGGVAALAAAATTFWVGIRTGRASADGPQPQRTLDGPLHDKLEVAHRFATAPDEELRANAALFLVVLDASGGDDLLWAGFTRLARMAESGTTERDRLMATRLLASARQHTPPRFVERWLGPLEARADRR